MLGSFDDKRRGVRDAASPRRIAVLLVSVLAATGLADGLVAWHGGPSYQVTVRLRSATADASCSYFHCPRPPATPHGDPYVSTQAEAITAPEFAAGVRRFLRDAPPSKQLAAHVSAEEIGQSPTIAISYVAGSVQQATVVATAYTHAYIAWVRQRTDSSVDLLIGLLKGQLAQLSPRQQRGSAGIRIVRSIASLQDARTGYTYGYGPDAPQLYPNPHRQVFELQPPPDWVVGSLKGVLAGLAFGAGLCLFASGRGRAHDAGGLDRNVVPVTEGGDWYR